MPRKTPPASLVTSITWIPADQLPDTDTTVLVACRDADEPVWLGYYDSAWGIWRTVDGQEITVTHWADLPQSPVAVAGRPRKTTR